MLFRSTCVQFRRGATAIVEAFVGADGEIAIDSTKHTIRVYDGSTAGGFEIAKADLSNTTAITSTSTTTLTNKSLSDSTTYFIDETDTTKKFQFQASGITTGTTRTLTIPDATGTVALTSNKLSTFAATTSAELAGVISDETGSGALVFATSPTFTTSINITSSGQTTQVQHDGTNGVLSSSTQLLLYSNGANATIFHTNSTERWRINSSGHLLAGADNTYDIGASGATRPRNIYIAGTGAIGDNTTIGGTTVRGKLTVDGGQSGTATSSAAFRTPGSAQSEKANLALYSTFEGTADNGVRRSADIISGFNGGAWGYEFLAVHVGSEIGRAHV